MKKLHKTCRAILAMIAVASTIGCDEKSKQITTNNETLEWQQFNVPGFTEFRYPRQLQLTAESGQGESKWKFTLTGSNGLKIETCGFYSLNKNGMENFDSMELLKLELQRNGPYKFEDMMPMRILSAQLDNETMTYSLWYVPTPDSNGAAIKHIKISFPKTNVIIADEIKSSWIANIKMNK